MKNAGVNLLPREGYPAVRTWTADRKTMSRDTQRFAVLRKIRGAKSLYFVGVLGANHMVTWATPSQPIRNTFLGLVANSLRKWKRLLNKSPTNRRRSPIIASTSQKVTVFAIVPSQTVCDCRRRFYVYLETRLFMCLFVQISGSIATISFYQPRFSLVPYEALSSEINMCLNLKQRLSVC